VGVKQGIQIRHSQNLAGMFGHVAQLQIPTLLSNAGQASDDCSQTTAVNEDYLTEVQNDGFTIPETIRPLQRTMVTCPTSRVSRDKCIRPPSGLNQARKTFDSIQITFKQRAIIAQKKRFPSPMKGANREMSVTHPAQV
jgi:hypothetical protein